MRAIISSPYISEKELVRQHLKNLVTSTQQSNCNEFSILTLDILAHISSRPHNCWHPILQKAQVDNRTPLEQVSLNKLLIFADYHRLSSKLGDMVEINIDEEQIDISRDQNNHHVDFYEEIKSSMKKLIDKLKNKKTSPSEANNAKFLDKVFQNEGFLSVKIPEKLLSEVINEIYFRCNLLAVQTLQSELNMKQRFISNFPEYLFNSTSNISKSETLVKQEFNGQLWLIMQSTLYPSDALSLSSRYKRHLNFIEQMASTYIPDNFIGSPKNTLFEELSHMCNRAILLAIDVETQTSRLPVTSDMLYQGRDDNEYDCILAIHNRIYRAVDGIKNFKSLIFHTPVKLYFLILML